ncbi:MAG: hypothetical protein FJ011_03770 [Chloroflexi bacterium]|nr:hypothetical protein [Chloroflexota bacterium]
MRKLTWLVTVLTVLVILAGCVQPPPTPLPPTKAPVAAPTAVPPTAAPATKAPEPTNESVAEFG